MNYGRLKNMPLLGDAYRATIMPRAKRKIDLILPQLEGSPKILDIGSGNCGVVKGLIDNGLDTTASDIRDLSFFRDIKPVIIENDKLPFEEGAFDLVMILTVLHHVPKTRQINLLREAKRVGNRVLVLEDVYSNSTQRAITYFMDSLVNLEFVGHPHSNRSTQEWEVLFKEMGFEIQSKAKNTVLGYFDQVLFSLNSMP